MGRLVALLKRNQRETVAVLVTLLLAAAVVATLLYRARTVTIDRLGTRLIARGSVLPAKFDTGQLAAGTYSLSLTARGCNPGMSLAAMNTAAATLFLRTPHRFGPALNPDMSAEPVARYLPAGTYVIHVDDEISAGLPVGVDLSDHVGCNWTASLERLGP
jgi:hypothetical protein